MEHAHRGAHQILRGAQPLAPVGLQLLDCAVWERRTKPCARRHAEGALRRPSPTASARSALITDFTRPPVVLAGRETIAAAVPRETLNALLRVATKKGLSLNGVWLAAFQSHALARY